MIRGHDRHGLDRRRRRRARRHLPGRGHPRRPAHVPRPDRALRQVPAHRRAGISLDRARRRPAVPRQRHRGDGQRRAAGDHHERQAERARRRAGLLQGQERRGQPQELAVQRVRLPAPDRQPRAHDAAQHHRHADAQVGQQRARQDQHGAPADATRGDPPLGHRDRAHRAARRSIRRPTCRRR